jgi:hypothetical protein
MIGFTRETGEQLLGCVRRAGPGRYIAHRYDTKGEASGATRRAAWSAVMGA